MDVRGKWQAWRDRFGLAEVCGTAGAVTGFATGYLSGASLLAAAGLATIGEVIGFYGWIGIKTLLAACRATNHLAGAAWLLLPLPGGVWLGLALGKATADVIWYGTEASVRRVVARTATT